MILTRERLASMIDYALVRPHYTIADIGEAAQRVRENQIGVLCVLPSMVGYASERLRGSKARVCSVVSFPFGASSTKAKVSEAEQAIEDGAFEIDMVMNIPLFKSGLYDRVRSDISAVVDAAKRRGLDLGRGEVTVKVIIETGYLTASEIALASRMVEEAGGDYVKTCTGFGPRGVTVEDIEVIRGVVKRAGIKAAGGISTFEKALSLIRAGATRIGTSHALEILNGWRPVTV